MSQQEKLKLCGLLSIHARSLACSSAIALGSQVKNMKNFLIKFDRSDVWSVNHSLIPHAKLLRYHCSMVLNAESPHQISFSCKNLLSAVELYDDAVIKIANITQP